MFSSFDLAPPLLAAVHVPFLTELVILFAVVVVMAYACHRLKLVPIIGFLLAGVLIGPYAFGFVQDFELINTMAEIGVILLLFTIGAEFSLDRLARIKEFIFIGGGLQVVLTIALVTGALIAFGINWRMGVFTGCLVALSSTAIVLKLLAERQRTDTPAGRISLGVLIFQDLAVIVMVLLIPMLGSTEGGVSALGVVWALARAVLIIVAVLLFARRIVPRLLERVARTRSHEIFLLAVVMLCLGTAWLTNLAGVSLALGAFMAGLIVSESRYGEHAVGEILPLQTIFTALFFVSVGMLLNLRFFLEQPALILGAALAVLLLKAVITGGSVFILGFPIRIALTSALALAQIGEFSFVLNTAGRTAGLSPAGLGEMGEQTFIAVTVLLMIATPFIMQAEPGLNRLVRRMGLAEVGRKRIKEEHAQGGLEAMEDHVITVGYGPAGRRLVRVMKESKIPFVVVELNPFSLEELAQQGIPALYGDASRRHILEMAGIERAKVLVVVINDPAATRRVVEVASLIGPTTQIIARARYITEVEPLLHAGADVVIPEELETSVQIFGQVLKAYMVPVEEVNRFADAVRADGYEVFRSEVRAAHLMVLEGMDEEGLHTRAVAVREGAPVAGRTLGELGLRQRHGLTVLAIRRGEKTISNPAGEFRLKENDRLVLFGMADQFAASADLFRRKVVEEES